MITEDKVKPIVLPEKKEDTSIYDALNRCRRCGIAGGKYREKETNKQIGVYLLSDARGYMMCNICASKGFLMGKEKLSKKDKKQLQHMRRELDKGIKIPHITLDRKGKQL